MEFNIIRHSFLSSLLLTVEFGLLLLANWLVFLLVEAASPVSCDKRVLVCRVLISLLAGSSLLIVQALIKLAQSFARRAEGSVWHAVAGSIDQSKGEHRHGIC